MTSTVWRCLKQHVLFNEVVHRTIAAKDSSNTQLGKEITHHQFTTSKLVLFIFQRYKIQTKYLHFYSHRFTFLIKERRLLDWR